MAYELRRNSALPQCAWAVDCRGSERVVHAGDRVEIDGGFIAEGAWEGDFSPEGASGSQYRCGSGAILHGPRLTLLPPTNSLDPVYVWTADGFSRAIASNSPHLVIALVPEADPGPKLTEARGKARTLVRGVANYERVLYTTPLGTLRRFVFESVEVDPGTGAVEARLPERPQAAPFSDFEGYRDYLLRTMGAVVDNARDPRRRRAFEGLVTSCSSGYDSSAGAALAAKLGCREALTLSRARGDQVDTGAPIAAALGLRCREFGRFGTELEKPHADRYNFYVDPLAVPERYDEFLGSLNTSEDLVFAPFEPFIAGSVFVTGFHGDKIWNMACDSGPEMVRGDNSGSGMDEFRKRVGFVHLPAPYIGVRWFEEIRAITQGPASQPWRVGGKYDRPIPRRIVEEAGVPRELFGFKKMAGSVDLDPNRGTMHNRRNRAFRAVVTRYREALNGGEAASRPAAAGASA